MTSRWTLILLPGMHGTIELFGPFTDILPADLPYRMIGYPTDRLLSYDGLARFVQHATRDITGDLVVVGESFSGPVALRVAAMSPRRVRAVVLVGSYARPPWPTALRWLALSGIFRLPIPRFVIRLLVAGWRLSGPRIDEIRAAIRRPDRRVLAARTREALSADSSAALRACHAPILAIHGRQDHLVLPINANRLRNLRPDIQLNWMNGPHLLLQVWPRQMWTLIQRFVETTAAP
jgi:pimeloyl-ACP methyl ester carboxylesterase